MKELLLKLAKVKSESEFYKKFPTKASFFKAHPEAKAILAQYEKEQQNNSVETPQEQMTGGPEETMEQMANGGGIDNPGFKALPKSVQENIISNMAMGGEVEKMGEGGIPQRYKNMGFTHVGQKKQGDGIHKWKVLAKKGDKYKVVQGGWRGMQDFKQHHSEKRRDRFWSRMGGKDSAKAHDPFSPLYWHKRLGTWADGGILPDMQDLIMASQQYDMGGLVQYPTYLEMGGMIGGPDMGYEDNYVKHAMGGPVYAYGMGGNIEINPEHKGMFTAWAKKHNMSVQEAASHVLANKDKYDTHTIKMAAFAHNFGGHKHAMGGDVYAMGGGIHLNPEHKGMFTKWANRHDMSVSEAANHVMANKDKYDAHTVQMANFAKNAAKWKHAMGGMVYDEGGIVPNLANQIPVQTEKYEGQPEQVVYPDNTIKSVDATTSHENMSDDKITDVLPAGSHIQSSRNKLTPGQYQQLIDMFTPEVAKERMKQIEQITRGKDKKISPAEISEYGKNKYQNKSTPNSFDTDKLKEGNKQSYIDLSIGMNDLIKAGKELAQGILPQQEPMMAWGGMVNKYLDGTPNYGIPSISNKFTTADDWDILKNYITLNPNGKASLLFPSNLPLDTKLQIEKAAENYDLTNLIQKYTPNTSGRFAAGLTGKDFEDKLALTSLGQEEYDKIKNDPNKVREVAYKIIGFNPTGNVDYNNPEFYSKFKKAFETKLPENMRPFFGNTGPMGLDYWNALKMSQPTPTPVAQTPLQKAAQEQLGAVNLVEPAAQIPMKNKYNYGLLNKQLNYGLNANELATNTLLGINPIYQMETPDTYIRSQKTEVPVGNILYNIEKAQRNAANQLSNETGDWSTLAGNIANLGATAMNQVGSTLSTLNEKNLDLYNKQQEEEQKLLGNNMVVKNANLADMQDVLNKKKNLLAKKYVSNASLMSNYYKSMMENQQEERNQKLNLLNTIASKPDMFKGVQGQNYVNQIFGTTGSYDNPFVGTPLDLFNQ
jgi:hypothetical protein